MPVKISSIEPGSPAEKVGLQAGMHLVRLDDHEITDGLDYEFYSSPAQLEITVQDNDGKQHGYHVVKQEYEPLGCVFESYLIDKHHSCKNKCMFCFIDQMPKGMRDTLYFKDDDERLSFLFGNYITLTNLTEKEVRRIIDMRIAPVNISVHTANPQLRVKMMKNKNAGEVLRYIPQLAQADIPLNTQLVLCPGVNDGDELRRSIKWLSQYRPALQSIAAVPVGVTKHREGLPDIKPYTKQQAAEQLDIMLEYGDYFAKKEGVRLVYPSDEWFLLAERPIPEEDFYDGYPQLENGVGMWRLTYEDFMQALDEVSRIKGKHEIDMVTGTLAAPLFEMLAEKLHTKFPKVQLHVHAIKNDFFGHSVTVAGLVTGQDMIRQLQGKLHSKTLLLPDVMLRAEGDLLLDDVSVEAIAQALSVAIKVVPSDGRSLVKAVIEA